MYSIFFPKIGVQYRICRFSSYQKSRDAILAEKIFNSLITNEQYSQ